MPIEHIAKAGLFSLLFLTHLVSAQTDAPEPAFQQVFPQSAYRSDLQELADRLTSVHPRPFAYISAPQFSALVERHKASIKADTTLSEVIWMFSSIVASIGCGHTSLGHFNQEDKLLPVSRRFPVDAVFVGDRLFVTDPLSNADTLSIGDEVVAINGLPVAQLREGIFAHIGTDGHIVGYKQGLTNIYLTAYIAYQLNLPTHYEVQLAGASPGQTYRLHPLTDYRYKPIVPPHARCQKTLCFEWLPEVEAGLVTIRSSNFYGERHAEFVDFVDAAMTDLQARGGKKLILDYRGNTGGSAFAAAHVLQYIADRPFTYFAADSDGADGLKQPLTPHKNRFDGRVLVLVDGVTLSSTGHFLSLVKTHGFAELVGAESGASYLVNANTQSFEASATKIRYRIAQSSFFTPVQGLVPDRGVVPDHPVSANIESILSGTDQILSHAMHLLSSRDQR